MTKITENIKFHPICIFKFIHISSPPPQISTKIGQPIFFGAENLNLYELVIYQHLISQQIKFGLILGLINDFCVYIETKDQKKEVY